MTDCLLREAREEIGIDIDLNNVIFTNIQHFKAPTRVYFDGYFFVERFKGEPKIMECDKCGELLWCDINDLPQPFRPERKQALLDFMAGKTFTQFGFPLK